MSGIELIAAEREKQKTQWSEDHDDSHFRHELVVAACCYAKCLDRRLEDQIPDAWPFEPTAWKPAGKLQNLIRAGALIAAEIDRLQRKAACK